MLSFIPSKLLPKSDLSNSFISLVCRNDFFFLHFVFGEGRGRAVTPHMSAGAICKRREKPSRHYGHLGEPPTGIVPLHPARLIRCGGRSDGRELSSIPTTPHSGRGAGNYSCQSFFYLRGFWNLEVVDTVTTSGATLNSLARQILE